MGAGKLTGGQDAAWERHQGFRGHYLAKQARAAAAIHATRQGDMEAMATTSGLANTRNRPAAQSSRTTKPSPGTRTRAAGHLSSSESPGDCKKQLQLT